MYFKKNIIKKMLVLAIFIITLCIPLFVFSQSLGGLSETAKQAGYTENQRDLYKGIGNVINIAFGTIAFIFFGLTLYAGIRWITARGEESMIEKAKSTMEAAIIGLVLVSLSYAIASFVVGRLGPSLTTEEGVNVVENCTGACAPDCVVGEKIDYESICKDEGYVCCIKEIEQTTYPDSDFCCVNTTANEGLNNKCSPLIDKTGLDAIQCLERSGNFIGNGNCNKSAFSCE